MLPVSVIHSFLLLRSIPLCGHATLCLSIHTLNVEYFGCFQTLAIISKVAINFQVFLWIDVFISHLGVGLLGHML